MAETFDSILARAVAQELRRDLLHDLREVVRDEVARTSRRDPDRLVDADEAAKLLGMTPAAVRKAAQRGTLPGTRRIGRRLRFRLGDLLANEREPLR